MAAAHAAGFTEPEAIGEAGAQDDWAQVERQPICTGADRAGHTGRCTLCRRHGLPRAVLGANARGMHVIELRSAPQGHPAYRRVCQQMHTLIAEEAEHRAIAAAMQFTDHSEVALERLGEERALERKRAVQP